MTTTITTKTLTIDDNLGRVDGDNRNLTTASSEDFVGYGGALGGGTADGSRNVVVDFGAVAPVFLSFGEGGVGDLGGSW